MIRDPSDGSVREPTSSEGRSILPTQSSDNGLISTTDEQLRQKLSPEEAERWAASVAETAERRYSGLRQPTRTDAQERLERSRQWLKDYQEKQNARGSSSEQEFSQAGCQIEGERQAES